MDLRIVHVRSLNRKPQSKQYKYMTVILKALHILFGLDLGFFAHKALLFRFIVKIFPLIQLTVAGVFIFKQFFENEFKVAYFYTLVNLLSHVCMVLLLSFSKRGATFMDLQENLEEIDVKLRFDFSCNNTEYKLIMIFIFIYIERLFVDIFNFFTHPDYFKSQLDNYAFVLLSACADIFISCYSFMFYSLYLRLAKLASMLETNDDFYSVWLLYKTIVDTVEKFKTALDPVYLLILIWNVPQVMMSIYFTLKNLQGSTDMLNFISLGVEYSYVLEVFVLTIAPALVAGMLTNQAKKIKSILHEKTLFQEQQHEEFLSQFIRYVEARPCRFRVWQLIPLSADLLGMVLSFCVTYLIVIIQFTHLK